MFSAGNWLAQVGRSHYPLVAGHCGPRMANGSRFSREIASTMAAGVRRM